MPANSDTSFWTDLGYTARRPFRTLKDYESWIGQLRDVPRYFHEQMQEMRAGLARGFTPPRITLEMAIAKARAKAESALGAKFNIRAFHDTVLELGSVPLPLLEARIEHFIAEDGRGPYPELE